MADFLHSHAFNIETEAAQSFSGTKDSRFGQMVAQFQSSTETWIIVSAPLEVNETGTRTGRIYKCNYTRGQCRPLLVVAPPEAGDISLGLSLAPRTVGEPSLLVSIVSHTIPLLTVPSCGKV
ncbi:integrin alpha-X-like [Rhincodon typus]|uniref:integrin alpha-X-like n=1 Tax=Rhincodon typus TaxID=259920 RepID=UPI00202EF918|nr:integrin alpha-X-like [Rhincodon typus]